MPVLYPLGSDSLIQDFNYLNNNYFEVHLSIPVLIFS